LTKLSTVIISVVRIRYLKLFEDFSWENSPSSMWSVGELTSAITCCCLPTLRPLVSRYFPNLIGGTTNRTAGAGYGTYGKSGLSGGKGATLASRTDTEMGGKRGIPLSGNDSIERDFPSPSHHRKGSVPDRDVELNDNLSPFRSGDDDARSLASEASELALAPKRPGVGVRTSIGPARPKDAAMSRSFSGGGVQVQRELFQTATVGMGKVQ
jgi:hypothetical protein